MSLLQTKEQERAASAWTNVEGVLKAYQKQYGSVVKKMPMLILTNGLGATLAFLLAKSTPKEGKEPSNENRAHEAACKHLSGWVMSQLQPGGKLMDWVRKNSSADSRRATPEALAYLNWLKRFVEAKGWGEEANADGK
jgi:CRISPR-associated protein Cmr5